MFAAVWSAVRETERVRLYFFHLALAETAVLGAFTAQDLALFVIFFDLMLVPFYFLSGGGATRRPACAATTKFVIYTLVGSLLMLAGAVALGVLSAGDGQPISFALSDLQRAHARAGHAVLDLPAVRRRLPGQGAARSRCTAGCPTPTARPRYRC